MSDRLIVEGLKVLNELFGRGTLYHMTNVDSADRIINVDRGIMIRDPEEEPDMEYGDEFETDEEIEELEFAPFISFTRSRGSTYNTMTGNRPIIVFEFNKGELLRRTRREAQAVTMEPYDFFVVKGSDSRIGNRGKRGIVTDYTYDSRSARAVGRSEMEERLWFIEPVDWVSKGALDSINKVHVVFKDNLQDMSADQLEKLLDKVEIRGVDTLFYKNHRDWVQGKALFDPFQYLS